MSDVSATKMNTHSPTRRVLVGIAGGLVLLIGVAMVILPGPAFIVIPIGLAILGSEFDCARKWLHKAREYIGQKFHRKREHELS